MSLRRKRIDFDVYAARLMESFQHLYLNVVENVEVTALVRPFDEPLFLRIADFLQALTRETCKRILTHDENLVESYANAWRNYLSASGYANTICGYLNKQLCEPSRDLPLGPAARQIHDRKRSQGVGGSQYKRQFVESLAFQVWRENVIYEIKSRHGNRLIQQILEMIRVDREGGVVSSENGKVAALSLVELCAYNDDPMEVYVEEFERPYLAQTNSYYEKEASRFIRDLPISDFLSIAQERLKQEYARARKYLSASSIEKAGREVEHHYITAHQALLQEKFGKMIEEEAYYDATLTYDLLARIPFGVTLLVDTYEKFIIRSGKAAVTQITATLVKSPKEYVDSLISLHVKYMAHAQDYFANDAAFLTAIDKAFRSITNDIRGVNAPEIVARYCDLRLRRTVAKTGYSDAEIEERLTQVKFYSRYLAKRLIFGLSVSDDAEFNMISRLKTACGMEYTSKLQRMFTDMSLSQDLLSGYRDHCSRKVTDVVGVDMGIMVLTAGSWPVTQQQAATFQLPALLEKSIETFTEFYNSKHSGRKLTWMWHLCKSDVRMHGMDKRYELNTSLYQAAVLLLFNDRDTLSWAYVSEQTRLGAQELTRVLKSLTDVKIVLSSTPEISSTSDFTLNKKFTNKRTKLKISTAQQIDTPTETETTHKSVEEDRKLLIQAIIVRIMKSRRELSHTALIQEVIQQASSRFSPSVTMIKRSIDQLIDKQYIERLDQKRDVYVYVA